MILIPRHKVMETPESASEIIFVCGQGLYVVRMPTQQWYRETKNNQVNWLYGCTSFCAILCVQNKFAESNLCNGVPWWWRWAVRWLVAVTTSAANWSIDSTTGCTITEKAPTRAFSWLKAATSAFTFKSLKRNLGVEPTVSRLEIGWVG